ncbi:MAG: A/G-specific adenine glycosylase [Lachnospiraceae bacterium]|nr:A/G-specific adenine glycosylase [Lachnospiraceae bacterium]
MKNKDEMRIEQDIVTPLLAWYDKSKRILPWRENKEPYGIWVSEIMLQQTRVEAVKPYFDRFMRELPCISLLAEAKEERLLKLWEGLGYYNRVRNMQKAAQIIMDEYGGSFPKEYELLLKLPGIGSYTAGAIASISFGKREPAVDGNVLRILSRLMLYEEDILSQKAKSEVRNSLIPLMPKERSGDFNQALMELGATVCVPNGAPHCEACPWKEMCLANKEDKWKEYPKKAAKKPRKTEQKTVLIIGDGERILLHKRPSKGLLAGMYELPSLEGYVHEDVIIAKVREMGFSPLRIQQVEEAKHIFTHKEWHMKGYRILTEPFDFASGERAILKSGYVMVSKEETKKAYPIPSAFGAFTEYLDIRPGIGKKVSR